MAIGRREMMLAGLGLGVGPPARVADKSGGSGQNGNEVNVLRAGSVPISGNRIADCAFSAIRSNSGSNCQMIGNSCARSGEVGLYAEFAFEGAVIASNIVDKAATGIVARNLNGPTPTGPDLARAGAEAFPNLAVYSNVAR